MKFDTMLQKIHFFTGSASCLLAIGLGCLASIISRVHQLSGWITDV